tara:strand:- start:272 stop:538 length:267 start_codon:yes stop_codon:yes gene_type:complete
MKPKRATMTKYTKVKQAQWVGFFNEMGKLASGPTYRQLFSHPIKEADKLWGPDVRRARSTVRRVAGAVSPRLNTDVGAAALKLMRRGR